MALQGEPKEFLASQCFLGYSQDTLYIIHYDLYVCQILDASDLLHELLT